MAVLVAKHFVVFIVLVGKELVIEIEDIFDGHGEGASVSVLDALVAVHLEDAREILLVVGEVASLDVSLTDDADAAANLLAADGGTHIEHLTVAIIGKHVLGYALHEIAGREVDVVIVEHDESGQLGC